MAAMRALCVVLFVASASACDSAGTGCESCDGGAGGAGGGVQQGGGGSGGSGGEAGGAGAGGTAGSAGSGGQAGGTGGTDAGTGGGAGSGGGGGGGAGGGASGLRLELTAPASVTVDTGNECFPLAVQALDGAGQAAPQPGQTLQLLLINDAGIPLPASFCDPGARWPDGGTTANFLFRPSYFGALGLRLALAGGLAGFTRLTVRSACVATVSAPQPLACSTVTVTPTIPPAEPLRCTTSNDAGAASCDAGCLLPAATAMATVSVAGAGPVSVEAPFMNACLAP